MKLVTYIARRLVLLIPVLIGISIITFALAWFATGGHLELSGDLGYSTSVNRPGGEVIATKFPASLELGFVAITFAIVVGIPLGILSATRRNTPIDHVPRFIALSGVSVPVFWLALILQLTQMLYSGFRPKTNIET